MRRNRRPAVSCLCRKFIARRSPRRLLELRGKLEWDPSYDYKLIGFVEGFQSPSPQAQEQFVEAVGALTPKATVKDFVDHWGENFLRVFRQVEAVSRQLSKASPDAYATPS